MAILLHSIKSTMPWHVFTSASLGGALLFAGAPPALAQSSEPWALTVYVQQSFPKQTTTNQQIDEQINQAFGVNFNTWDDIANLSVGTQLFRKIHPRLEVGLEFDYSRGGLHSNASIPTPAGPASLEFAQTYGVYTNVLAVAHYLPCVTCEH